MGQKDARPRVKTHLYYPWPRSGYWQTGRNQMFVHRYLNIRKLQHPSTLATWKQRNYSSDGGGIGELRPCFDMVGNRDGSRPHAYNQAFFHYARKLRRTMDIMPDQYYRHASRQPKSFRTWTLCELWWWSRLWERWERLNLVSTQ